MVALFIVAGVMALVGGLMIHGSLPNLRRRQRIIAMPTSSIAQASGNGPVEIKGRISPSELGVVHSPFSNKPAVWARISVQEWRQQGRSGSWVTIIQESEGRPFMVDDGSGQSARVLPDGAIILLDEKEAARSGTFRDANPQLEAFLQSRGHKSTSFFGTNKSMRFVEEILAPGEDLFALGPSRREPGPPVNDGYRMVPSSMLVMSHGGNEQNELILTNRTEAQLVSKLLHGVIAGAVILGIAVVAVAIGVAMMVEDALDRTSTRPFQPSGFSTHAANSTAPDLESRTNA